MTGDTLMFPWRVEQGERELIEIPIIGPDDAPADITGWIVDAQIKTAPGGETLYTWPAELITVAADKVTLTLPGPVSATWTFTAGWWRVVISEPTPPDPADPDTFRVIQGAFVVDRS